MRAGGEPPAESEHTPDELAFQQALLSSQSEASIDGIFAVSPDHRVQYWNQRLLEMWKLPESLLAAGDAFAVMEYMATLAADAERFSEIARAVVDDPSASRREEIELADGRVLDRWTAPVHSPTGVHLGRVLFYRDVTEQKSTERRLRESEQWSSFLADASRLLAQSTDYEDGLRRLARLAVPVLGDWCVIHVAEKNGDIRQLAVSHVDEAKLETLRRLNELYPSRPREPRAVADVVRTGEPALLEELPPEMLEEGARDEQHRQWIRSLGMRSAMILPLICRDRVIGAISLASAESGRRYTKEDLRRAEDLATHAAFPLDNARLLEEQTRVARTLQNSLLPPALPEIPGVDLSARYFSAGEGIEVGGDFYDVFRTGRRTWGMVIGDVTGKGVEAATVTALARHTIRASAMTTNRPSEILALLNTALLEQAETDRLCTAIYTLIEPRYGRLRVTLSGAGHPLPYVVRSDGTIEQVPCKGTLLGALPSAEFVDVAIDLEFGDKLFVYTDGILDDRRSSRPFAEPELESLLAECSKRGAHSAAEEVARTLLKLQEGAPGDDIAFLFVGVRASIFRSQSRSPVGESG